VSDVRNDPRTTALLVVDVQNDFCHETGVRHGGRLVDMDAAVDNMERLVQAARAAGVPVLFVRTEHSTWTNSSSWLERRTSDKASVEACVPGTWGAEIYRLQPTQRDKIVTKHRYSAFIGTDLDLILRTLGVKHLVVTGVNTNICVDSTARHGFMLDYLVSVPQDGCTTTGPRDYHDAALKLLDGHFAKITMAADHIGIWSSAT
jgi:ureidoacrylate peracid hydrolase